MDSNRKVALLEKYWTGNASLAEEKELLLHLDSIEKLSEEEKVYFKQLQQFSQLSLGQEFNTAIIEKIEAQEAATINRLLPTIFWKVAAAVLLIASFTFLLMPSESVSEPLVIAEQVNLEEDPEKAFEITKQALLLVSANLNKASKLTVGLDKFKETQEKIKME